jgi:hypothetical protein
MGIIKNIFICTYIKCINVCIHILLAVIIGIDYHHPWCWWQRMTLLYHHTLIPLYICVYISTHTYIYTYICLTLVLFMILQGGNVTYRNSYVRTRAFMKELKTRQMAARGTFGNHKFPGVIGIYMYM